MTTRFQRQRPRPTAKVGGQSFLEYIVVLMFAVIVLVSGSNPPIKMLATAIQEYYTDYSFAISVSAMPDCFIDKSAGPLAVSADLCLDAKNPQWPVSLSVDF